MLWQSIDLVDAKDGIGFEEWDIPLDSVAVILGQHLGERLAYTRCAGLALADMRAEFTGLLGCHPGRRAETARDGFDESNTTLMPSRAGRCAAVVG